MSTLALPVQRIARRQSESRLVEKPDQKFEDKATGTKTPGALMAFWPINVDPQNLQRVVS